MMHVQIIDGTIANPRATPTGGAWEDDAWLDFSDPDTLAAWEVRHGLTRVTETPRPVDTETVKHDERIALVAGVPTQTWTPRPWNAAEIAERDARLARVAERETVRALVDGINASIDEAKAAKVAAQAVLDATAPTNVTQVWARVKDLARAVRDTDNALISAEQGVKDIAKYLKDS